MPKGIYQRIKGVNCGLVGTKGKHWKIKDTSKMGKFWKDRKMPLDARKKMSKSKLGIKHTKEHNIKIRDTARKRVLEGTHNWWKGGISCSPYSVNWTEDLKRSIRKRDKYTCQICGKEPSIIVHHIDYDKLNCNSDNLVVVCKSCHSKTNGDRDYWKQNLQKNNNKLI